jgi:hypothetical protein
VSTRSWYLRNGPRGNTKIHVMWDEIPFICMR